MPRTSSARSAMIGSAADLLRVHGVAGTSFTRVIDDSGAPRGSISHHFPGGKRQLLAEAVRSAGGAATDAMGSAVLAGATSGEVFSAVCGRYRRALVDTGHVAGCPVAAVALEATSDDVLRSAVHEVFAAWRDVLASCLRREGRPDDEARDLADLCIAAVEGALLMARVERSTRALDAVHRQVGRLLQT